MDLQTAQAILVVTATRVVIPPPTSLEYDKEVVYCCYSFPGLFFVFISGISKKLLLHFLDIL